MKIQFYLLGALAFLASCTSIPEIENRQVLNSLVGKPAIQVLREFGTPTGHYQISGHLFLSYKTTETAYSSGFGGFDSVGVGFDDNWDGGFDGGFWGPEIPPTYYSSTCQTTFEIVKKKVTAWKMRGAC